MLGQLVPPGSCSPCPGFCNCSCLGEICARPLLSYSWIVWNRQDRWRCLVMCPGPLSSPDKPKVWWSCWSSTRISPWPWSVQLTSWRCWQLDCPPVWTSVVVAESGTGVAWSECLLWGHRRRTPSSPPSSSSSRSPGHAPRGAASPPPSPPSLGRDCWSRHRVTGLVPGTLGTSWLGEPPGLCCCSSASRDNCCLDLRCILLPAISWWYKDQYKVEADYIEIQLQFETSKLNRV